jgi:hypothetical protein
MLSVFCVAWRQIYARKRQQVRKKTNKLVDTTRPQKKKRPPQYPPKAERAWRSEREAAEHIGVTVNTLRKMRRLGTAPVHYSPTGRRCIRYLVVELDRHVDNSRGKTA